MSTTPDHNELLQHGFERSFEAAGDELGGLEKLKAELARQLSPELTPETVRKIGQEAQFLTEVRESIALLNVFGQQADYDVVQQIDAQISAFYKGMQVVNTETGEKFVATGARLVVSLKANGKYEWDITVEQATDKATKSGWLLAGQIRLASVLETATNEGSLGNIMEQAQSLQADFTRFKERINAPEVAQELWSRVNAVMQELSAIYQAGGYDIKSLAKPLGLIHNLISNIYAGKRFVVCNKSGDTIFSHTYATYTFGMRLNEDVPPCLTVKGEAPDGEQQWFELSPKNEETVQLQIRE